MPSVVQQVTDHAEQLLVGGAEGRQRTRRRITLNSKLTGTFKASPESRARMIRESSDLAFYGEAYSEEVTARVRLHQELRSEATEALFRELGAFQGSGLVVSVKGAQIQVGRGSSETPAAHICPAPSVYLELPDVDAQIQADTIKRLSPAHLTAIVRAGMGEARVIEWGLPKAELSAGLSQVQLQEVIDLLRRGILIEGTVARLGGTTIEVPKAANEFDSDLERSERATIQEGLNRVVQGGEPWRDVAAEVVAALKETSNEFLTQEIAISAEGARIRDLAARPVQNRMVWQAIVRDLQGKAATSRRWKALLDAVEALMAKLDSPGKLSAVRVCAAAASLHHHRKAEVAAQAIQAMKTPRTTRLRLGTQPTPSPGTVAGTQGDALASVRPRRRDWTSMEGRKSPAASLVFDDVDDQPVLKRPCLSGPG